MFGRFTLRTVRLFAGIFCLAFAVIVRITSGQPVRCAATYALCTTEFIHICTIFAVLCPFSPLLGDFS